ncbi:hypothetical protein THS27_16550 [Thalassospira sp. MCCC 1A01428]|nr:hypothetical protein THS27_16550 [Thalassospira sp. MCCC 1A01428]
MSEYDQPDAPDLSGAPGPDKNKALVKKRPRPVKAGPGLAYFNWALITFMLAALVIIFEPDEFTRPVDEYSYELFNRLFGAAVYDAPNKDDIGIVLFDQKSLHDLDASWPPLFLIHSNVLKSVLRSRGPFPLAVFMDFTLQDARSSEVTIEDDATKSPRFVLRDDTLGELVKTVENYGQLGIPVYVAAGKLTDDRFPEILSRLKGKVKLVAGWGDALSNADIRALNYSLFPNRPGKDEANNNIAGQVQTAARARDYYPAPALQIYLDLCRRRAEAMADGRIEDSPFFGRNWNCDGALRGSVPKPDERDAWQLDTVDLWRGYAQERPMSLIWPDSQPDYSGWPVMITTDKAEDGREISTRHFPSACPASDEKDFSFLVGFFHRLGTHLIGHKGVANHCGPFDVVTAGQAVKSTPDAANSLISKLGGRVIFYSFNLQGLQDVVHPPTLDDDIAGVNVHAMALENLLHYGPDYLSDTSRQAGPVLSRVTGFLTSDNLELLTMAGLFLVRLVFLLFVRKWGVKSPIMVQSNEVPDGQTSDPIVCKLGWDMVLYYRQCLYDLIVWFGNFPRRQRIGFMNTTNALRQYRFPISFFLVVEFMCVVVFVFGVAFWLEFSVLRIAPSNWLSILGLAGVTYPFYIRALFSQPDTENVVNKEGSGNESPVRSPSL